MIPTTNDVYNAVKTLVEAGAIRWEKTGDLVETAHVTITLDTQDMEGAICVGPLRMPELGDPDVFTAFPITDVRIGQLHAPAEVTTSAFTKEFKKRRAKTVA